MEKNGRLSLVAREVSNLQTEGTIQKKKSTKGFEVYQDANFIVYVNKALGIHSEKVKIVVEEVA